MKTINFFLILFLLISFSCKNTLKEEENNIKTLTYFKHVPTKPKNGNLFGLVELGAAGFNAFIVNVDDNLNWEFKTKEFGVSLLVEGMTNTELINQKLRDYIEKITTYGISKKDIYFVVSSGAAKEEITQLISKELENIGYKINTVTVEEEGTYALKSVLPKQFIENSFLVDMGSGNTKISYFNTDGSTETLETHGAKYYQKGIEDEDVYKNIREISAKIPLKNRTKCFLIGGVPTQMARKINPKEELYTVLDTDAKTFDELAKKEGKKVQSGLNIYKALQEETQTKEIIYVLDGNFTVGFLLEKLK